MTLQLRHCSWSDDRFRDARLASQPRERELIDGTAFLVCQWIDTLDCFKGRVRKQILTLDGVVALPITRVRRDRLTSR